MYKNQCCPTCFRPFTSQEAGRGGAPLYELLSLQQHANEVYESMLDLSARLQTLRKVFEGEPRHVPALACQLGQQIYLEIYSIAIRRMVDDDEGSYSLVSFLRRLSHSSSRLNRSWFRERFGSDRSGEQDNERVLLANRCFDDIAGRGASSLDVLGEMRKLKKSSRNIKNFTTSRYAHALKKPKSALITAQELGYCRQLAFEILQKCMLLLEYTSIEIDPAMLW